MTDFSSVSIRPPKDWQAFERHARVLFQCVLKDPHTQNNGRSGQPQHGVDIFGRRGGVGPYAGIQCKGKNADYGRAVTKAELRREVEKSRAFEPEINEFILITTAPDDAAIQEAARLLEVEVRAQGRDLRIAVWGWETLQQEIARYPEAIEAFHPDATPFTTVILDQGKQIEELVRQQGERQTAAQLSLEERLSAIEGHLRASVPTVDREAVDDPLDRHIHDEIDTYRNLINEGRPRTAIALLESLRARLPDHASARVRFRILANMGVARHRLGEYDAAAELFLESSPLSPDEPNSVANKIAALVIQQRTGEAHALAVEAVRRFPDNEFIALQRLQALAPGETVNTGWSSLPATLTAKPQLVVARIAALRGASGWNALLHDALRAFPDNAELRLMQAEHILATILESDRAAFGAPSAARSDPIRTNRGIRTCL
jgi:tetratricopeptide (TPR) repeat protein